MLWSLSIIGATLAWSRSSFGEMVAKDKFKNALRFKLVQKSVRDQNGSTTTGDVGEGRTFAPLNEAAYDHMVFTVIVSLGTNTALFGMM